MPKSLGLGFPRHSGFKWGCCYGIVIGTFLSSFLMNMNSKTDISKHSKDKGYYVQEGRLFGNLQLSSDFTNEGALIVPDAVKRIWIEIGANSRDLAQTIIKADESLGDILLLTFEPLVDKYGFIASTGTGADSRRRVGHQSSDGQMLVFPFAVSETSGVSEFNVANVDGCSSLLPMKGGKNYKGAKESWQWFIDQCATAQETRYVPTIAFTEILETWLQGHIVDWVKIDAQGFDVQLVQAAGKSVKQLKKISMETTKDSCDTMYEGALKCSDMYRIMSSLGFLSDITCETASWDGNGGCESEQFHWINSELH